MNWERVVGTEEGARDAAKFRVLEWGGIEVLLYGRGGCPGLS